MNRVFWITGREAPLEEGFSEVVPGPLPFRAKGRFAEKIKTLACVAQSPFVAAVSFIPEDLSIPQLLFARRTAVEDRTGFVPPRAFYEGALAPYTALLTRENFTAATRGLEAQWIGQARNILDRFLKDRETRAIALTIDGLGQKITYIWAKPDRV